MVAIGRSIGWSRSVGESVKIDQSVGEDRSVRRSIGQKIDQSVSIGLSLIAVVVHWSIHTDHQVRTVIQSVGQSRLIKEFLNSSRSFKYSETCYFFGIVTQSSDLFYLKLFYFNWNGHTYNFLHNCRIRFVRTFSRYFMSEIHPNVIFLILGKCQIVFGNIFWVDLWSFMYFCDVFHTVAISVKFSSVAQK